MGINVLIADDHRLVRDGLRALLEDHKDITVVGEAADGREAVRQATDLAPDVIVMDIAMPEMNGIEATRQILENSSTPKVIMLSMYSTSEHIFRSFKAGANGYLLKESVGSDIINAIRAVHGGRRYLSEKVTEKVLDDYIYQRDLFDSESPLSRLSKREREVLQLMVEGKPSSEIGTTFAVSVKTIHTYRSRIMHKLGINDVPRLVKFALQHGLCALEQ